MYNARAKMNALKRQTARKTNNDVKALSNDIRLANAGKLNEVINPAQEENVSNIVPKHSDRFTRGEKMDSTTWLNTVIYIPVGQVIQYRDNDSGKVVYWHIRQASLQATSKKCANGNISKVRKNYIQLVNAGKLFITHV